MHGGKPLFLRCIEIDFIQKLLLKRGKGMDWMIIKGIDEDIGKKFNPKNTETSTKTEVIFIRQREIDHMLHHLYVNRTEYCQKIMKEIVEQTGIPFIVSRSCFTDYHSSN